MPSADDKARLEPGETLSVQEMAWILRRMPNVLRELILALPRRAVEYHPGLEKWCIKEVVGHLTEEDKRDFVGRIESMLHQESPRLEINNQDDVARERYDCAKDIVELLDEFASVRNLSVRLVERLSADDLERAAVHPNIGLVRVREVLHEWLYHDLNHLKQVERNAQRLIWHQLGNMQGFYVSRTQEQ